MAFIVTGVAGLVWLIAWWIVCPEGPPRSGPTAEAAAPSLSWRTIVTDRTVWLFALARAAADPVWYFYLFWFPIYLIDERAMSLASVAAFGWIVYLAADLGSLGGGAASSWLVRRGTDPARSRLIVMALAGALAPLGALASLHPPLAVLFAIASLVAFAHLVFQINIGTLIVDLYPSRQVATIFGLIAAGSGLGGMASTQLVGLLVQGGSFDRVFVIMAALHPIAFGLAWLACRAGRSSPLLAANRPDERGAAEAP